MAEWKLSEQSTLFIRGEQQRLETLPPEDLTTSSVLDAISRFTNKYFIPATYEACAGLPITTYAKDANIEVKLRSAPHVIPLNIYFETALPARGCDNLSPIPSPGGYRQEHVFIRAATDLYRIAAGQLLHAPQRRHMRVTRYTVGSMQEAKDHRAARERGGETIDPNLPLLFPRRSLEYQERETPDQSIVCRYIDHDDILNNIVYSYYARLDPKPPQLAPDKLLPLYRNFMEEAELAVGALGTLLKEDL